jgi:hypothetical protein
MTFQTRKRRAIGKRRKALRVAPHDDDDDSVLDDVALNPGKGDP